MHNKKNVLITGVTGFIGSHLAKKLNELGHNVYGVTKYSSSRDMGNLKYYLSDTVLLTANIEDYYSTYNLLKSVDMDIVVHLAALSPVRDSFEKPHSYVETNINGTLNIINAMLKLPDYTYRKFIYASTAEVYGIQEKQPIKEDAPLRPSSPYAITKAMTDMYAIMVNKVYDMNTTIMRCTNTYGRKLDSSFYIEYLVTSMLKGNKIYVGAPESIRDYMYVDDHVNAYIKAIENYDIKGEAFNFGTKNIISNKDIAYQIAELIGYDKRNIVVGEYPPNYPIRPLESDQPFIVLDSEKSNDILRWAPKIKLEEGIKNVINLWKGKISL